MRPESELILAASPQATLEVNGTTQFDNAVTFASAQTFPGAGTITGVTASAGLFGGGTTGNVSLSLPAAGVSNVMLANPGLSVNAGAGLTGGGSVSLGGSTTVALATNTCAAGSAVTAHLSTCSPFAGLGENTFMGNQAMPNLTVTGNIATGGLNSTTSGPGPAVQAYNTSSYGVFASSTNSYGIYGISTNFVGISGGTSSRTAPAPAGLFNNGAAGKAANILLGQRPAVTRSAWDAKGATLPSASERTR